MKKKKENMLFHIVDVAMFDSHIAFSLGEADEDFQLSLSCYEVFTEKEIKYALEWDKTTVGRTIFFDDGYIFVRMKNFPESCDDYGTLHHEIFHAIVRLLKRKGIKLCDKSEEFYAYLISHITEEIYLEINKLV